MFGFANGGYVGEWNLGSYSSDTFIISLSFAITLFWAIALLLGIRIVLKAANSRLWSQIDAKCNNITFIQKPHSDGDEYRVRVDYEYTFDSKCYRGSTFAIGYCGSSCFEAENEKYERLIEQKNNFRIYVNPLDPRESCVIQGNDKSNYTWVALPAIGWVFCLTILLIVYFTRGGAHFDF